MSNWNKEFTLEIIKAKYLTNIKGVSVVEIMIPNKSLFFVLSIIMAKNFTNTHRQHKKANAPGAGRGWGRGVVAGGWGGVCVGVGIECCFVFFF